MWSEDGHELFYRRLSDGAMMVVPISDQPGLTPGRAQLLFEGADYSTGAALGDDVLVNYDVTADGQRFLMLKGSNPQVRVTVVHNWREELLERVPVN